MTRGTTPTCRFALPFEASALSGWVISFAQRGVEKFSVEDSECTASGRTITATLSQADTLKLEAGVDAQIQLRGVSAGGTAVASEILTVEVKPVLKGGVIE